jgi:predicted transcriptional regulator
MSKVNLGKKELEVMTVFWGAKKPLIIQEIVDREPQLNKNTVAATVKKLLSKNYIEVAEVVYHGRVLARAFQPILKKEDYLLSQMEKTNINLGNMVLALVKKEDNIDTLKEIEEQIAKKRKQLEEENESGSSSVGK